MEHHTMMGFLETGFNCAGMCNAKTFYLYSNYKRLETDELKKKNAITGSCAKVI